MLSKHVVFEAGCTEVSNTMEDAVVVMIPDILGKGLEMCYLNCLSLQSTVHIFPLSILRGILIRLQCTKSATTSPTSTK